MRILTFPLLATLAAVSLACGPDRAPVQAAPSPRSIERGELEGIILRASEGPPGTEYVVEQSGDLSLDGLWPTSCCPTMHALMKEAGFDAAAHAYFEKPGHSDDPVDTREGWELVASSAVLFETEAGASEALELWVDYYRDAELEPLPTEGLGEEAIALWGSPTAPAETMFIYAWRMDRLLLVLRVSSGRGTVGVPQVRELVDRMDARAS